MIRTLQNQSSSPILCIFGKKCYTIKTFFDVQYDTFTRTTLTIKSQIFRVKISFFSIYKFNLLPITNFLLTIRWYVIYLWYVTSNQKNVHVLLLISNLNWETSIIYFFLAKYIIKHKRVWKNLRQMKSIHRTRNTQILCTLSP